jgi:hypothetical protein
MRLYGRKEGAAGDLNGASADLDIGGRRRAAARSAWPPVAGLDDPHPDGRADRVPGQAGRRTAGGRAGDHRDGYEADDGRAEEIVGNTRDAVRPFVIRLRDSRKAFHAGRAADLRIPAIEVTTPAAAASIKISPR